MRGEAVDGAGNLPVSCIVGEGAARGAIGGGNEAVLGVIGVGPRPVSAEVAIGVVGRRDATHLPSGLLHATSILNLRAQLPQGLSVLPPLVAKLQVVHRFYQLDHSLIVSRERFRALLHIRIKQLPSL